MTTRPSSLDQVLVGDIENWEDGPPHDLFKRMRSECPVHWSSQISQFPEEDGFWYETYLYSRAATIYGGTQQIQRNIIADRVLSLPQE